MVLASPRRLRCPKCLRCPSPGQGILGDQGHLSATVVPLRQSRLMSLIEAGTNVLVGFLLALLTQIAIFPLFSLAVSVADNLLISGIFTAVSVVRSFLLRRLFEAVRASRWK